MIARLRALFRESPETLAGDFLGAFSLAVMLVAFLHLPSAF
ncbi:hypothetical protein SAMN05216257_10815 [Meinhardsimonia xiamenensis]|jgi:hypothetical protein|uniref:Uncharacterized protein n=1 Tax=Meinhardsimonia xiamenensis TaxID=990712 RepID=A0A1G9GLW7_9RHOB|nr:hypothetical protein [Meinhardsimonia xiamenensis]PRX30548.1 hypothetical protein LV81_02770 [Meinhardsimonia xiamenensis]SDL01688.1 hypothetical protein SAMN05216257_10815 [Meinhardsimonia xiamenensis]